MSRIKSTSRVYGPSLLTQIRRGEMSPDAARVLAPDAHPHTRRLWDQAWKLREASKQEEPKFLKFRKLAKRVGMFLIRKAAI